MALVATVTIRPGLEEIVLLGTVGHEGSHVLHGQEFVATMKWTPEGGMAYDLSKNLTVFDLEMNAFGITHAVHAEWGKGGGISWPCNKCVLGKPGMPDPEVALAISRILVNDTKNYFNATKKTPGPRQFPDWK